MNALQQSIEELLKDIDIQKLKKTSSALTEHYREGLSLASEEELLCYLITRLPATYAALLKVFSQIPSPGSLLDLGAGPGTVWWVAQELWGQTAVTAIEKQSTFIQLGKKLGAQAHWLHQDLLSKPHFEPHDWVIFGYSLGELPQKQLQPLFQSCWNAAQKGIILVEPGTPRGYQNILQARDFFIKQGAFVHAPCPHNQPCPLKTPDWCHFSVRLERSFLHRAAKMASLPFEDEKFSYMILTHKAPSASQSRILRAPIRRSGHVLLHLCTESGLELKTVSKKEKERYKKARKANWGDCF